MVICDSKVLYQSYKPTTARELTLTRLSNYIPLFTNQNIVFIKIDIEGSEGKAIEGGIELITKYNVPFIFLEFSPGALKFHGTDPEQFLQLFANNEYKFGISNFFDKKYYTVKEILKISKKHINLYIVHSKVLEWKNKM